MEAARVPELREPAYRAPRECYGSPAFAATKEE
jgi:hypothetical protein